MPFLVPHNSLLYSGSSLSVFCGTVEGFSDNIETANSHFKYGVFIIILFCHNAQISILLRFHFESLLALGKPCVSCHTCNRSEFILLPCISTLPFKHSVLQGTSNKNGCSADLLPSGYFSFIIWDLIHCHLYFFTLNCWQNCLPRSLPLSGFLKFL